MIFKRFLHIVFSLFAFYMVTTGCKKEYSYEGGPGQDSLIVPEPIIIPDSANVIIFPPCFNCTTPNVLSEPNWAFGTDSSVVCGAVTNAVVSPDGDAMTFFGPSTCWPDEGLIITAYFGKNFLDGNRINFISNKASLVYYDNVTRSDKFISRKEDNFIVLIEQYSKQSGIASGSFSGTVVDENNQSIKIKGAFVIQL